MGKRCCNMTLAFLLEGIFLFVLQCCVSCMYAYIPSILTCLPPPPSHPSSSSQRSKQSSLGHTRVSHYCMHGSTHMSVLLSQTIPSFPRCVHKPIPYVCIPIPVLEISSAFKTMPSTFVCTIFLDSIYMC